MKTNSTDGMDSVRSPQDGTHWARQPKAPIVMSTVDNLQVLFEDNHLIAVNKRSSDIVQSDSSGDVTLCQVVGEYIKRKYNKPGDAFIGTVHRLDRPVSGVILYARTTKALSRLSNMFRMREIQKTYWAVSRPGPSPAEGHIVNFLEKNSKTNKSHASDFDGPNKKQSELTYQTIGRSDHYTFVEVKPKTGRHHQIRATLASLGSPIKGDIKYGARRTNDNASIHLHARRIEFNHPVRKIPITILAPPPDDPIWNEWLRIEAGIAEP